MIDPLAPPGDRRAAMAGRRMAIIVLAAAFAFNFIGRGIADSYLVFMLALRTEFGWSQAALAGVYSVYLLTAGVAAPLSGMVLDRFGPRVTYGGGVLLLALSLQGAARTESLVDLYVTLGLGTGLACSALGMVPAAALIGRWFSGRLTSAMGVAYAGFGSGILLLVPLSQLSIEAIGWRDTYRLFALVLVLCLPFVLVLPWRRMAAGQASSFGSPPVHPSTGTADPPGAFTLRQAVATAVFWRLVQVFFFTAAGMHAVIVQTVAYLVSAGYRPIEAASAFGIAGMLSIAGVLSAGWLADRFGPRRTALASFVGSLAGIAALASASHAATGIGLICYIVFFGVSQGARGPIVSALTSRHFRNGPVGAIFGVIVMLMSIGSAFGAWMSGVLHGVTGAYGWTFVFSTIAFLIALQPFLAKAGFDAPANRPG